MTYTENETATAHILFLIEKHFQKGIPFFTLSCVFTKCSPRAEIQEICEFAKIYTHRNLVFCSNGQLFIIQGEFLGPRVIPDDLLTKSANGQQYKNL